VKFEKLKDNHVDNSNLYRKQSVRRDDVASKKIDELIQEVESLSEQNRKLKEELTMREELMQNLFSYIETNSTPKA
jgi:cell shape-determining protein MreC